jgi:hypothetical protein
MWQPFFDSLTKSLTGSLAEVEVASLDLGDQIEAEWTPLIGISYDPKDDIVDVALEGLDHRVRGPRDIYVDFDAGGLVSLAIIDADDVRQIVKLKNPLALPPAAVH